jgi:hypothetical protein
VRLIKLDEGDVVSSLAKLPEDELGDGLELEPTTGEDGPADILEGSAEPAHGFGDADPGAPGEPGEADSEGDADASADGLEDSE